MKAIGQARCALVAPLGAAARARARPAGLALLGLVCALLPALYMWGFTVDDALISVRYARNVASGAGFRFDPAGPATDGVTPLPWPFVLAALSLGARGADALALLGRAKVLGVALAALGGARLGWALARTRAPLWACAACLGVLALAVPAAAHAASGMETSLATCLATFAATSRGRHARATLAGLTAAFRPELLPWALTLTGLSELGAGAGSPRPSAAARAGALGLAAAPFGLCVLARLVAFGHAAPLAVAAKPSDLAHGLPYAGAALLACLTPVVACAPLALARARDAAGAVARALVLAALVHAAVVVFVGGDWMPYARLVAPLAPGLVFAACALAACAPSAGVVAARWLGARLVAALALGTYLFVRTAPSGRDVWADRRDLVRRATPELAGARVVAALDIGWVSAATDAKLVDLAGLTDPEIAALPGGHTSKRVAASVLLDRGADVVLVYSTAGGERLGVGPQPGMRVVEARLVRSELFERWYEARVFLPLGARGAGYVVYRRR